VQVKERSLALREERKVKEGIWKFLYWPLLWLLTLGLPYLLLKNVSPFEGVWKTISRTVGAALMVWAFFIHGVAGRTLRYFGHKDPKNRSIWPDKLVVDGIYSCMRHPQHLGLSLVAVALSLLLASPIAILSSGWAVVGTLLFVLFVEEPECLEKFGRDYYEYMKRVKAFTLDPKCVIRGVNYIREHRPA